MPCVCHFMHKKKETHGSGTGIKEALSFFEIQFDYEKEIGIKNHILPILKKQQQH